MDKAAKLHLQLLDSLKSHNIRDRGMHPAPLGNGWGIGPILKVLWDLVVHPILNEIEDILCDIQDDSRPHIIWCPTGPLSFLPLHAAGIYGSDQHISISDFAVSSYTPTLTALLGKQSERPQELNVTSKVLIVSQPNTPNLSSIPRTVDEAKSVQAITAGLHLDHQQATVSAVLQKLKYHDCVHLACHGVQDLVDPLKSAFALHDGAIDLQTLMKTSLKGAQLAFLSACQTATGDIDLPDEAVHLASGMLAVGYRSVIGTMWSIRDSDGPLVADAFYASLFENSSDSDGKRLKMNAAYALHDALKRLRDDVGETEFLRWVPFVHFGV